MDFGKWFAKRLKQLRHEYGDTSQAMLAEECGIGKATYERLERGVCLPRMDTCILIAKYYNISLCALLSGYEDEVSDIYIEDST